MTTSSKASREKKPFTVNGKRIWAFDEQDAQWQYEQMEKQLSKMRR